MVFISPLSPREHDEFTALRESWCVHGCTVCVCVVFLFVLHHIASGCAGGLNLWNDISSLQAMHKRHRSWLEGSGAIKASKLKDAIETSMLSQSNAMQLRQRSICRCGPMLLTASMQLRHRPLSDAGFGTGCARLRCKAIEHRCASVSTADQINFADAGG